MFLPRNRAGAVLLASLAFAPGHATSAAQGWGKVNMHGAIIDTACAIAAGSRDQTIDMDTIPLGQIIRDGQDDQTFQYRIGQLHFGTAGKQA